MLVALRLVGETKAAALGGFPGRGGLSPAHVAGRTPAGVLDGGLETTSGRASCDSGGRCGTSLSSVTIEILVEGVEALGPVTTGVVPKSRPEEDLRGGAGASFGDEWDTLRGVPPLGGRLFIPRKSEVVRLVVDIPRLRALDGGRSTPSGRGLEEPEVPNATPPPFLKVELAS